MLFESMSSDDCRTQSTRVDIWQIPLHKEPDWAFSYLNPEERTRAQRYHFARHQRRFTVARAMLRLILARYLKTDPHAITFNQNSHGKPYLCDSTLQFNVSHSKDLALIGVGIGEELGIDLEYFSDRPYLGIADHVFSPTEILTLSQLPLESQQHTFFNIWAQKEAFIKAVGMGLAYPLKQLSVPTEPNTDSEIIDSLTHKTWHLIAFDLTPTCAAALCVSPKVKQIRRIELTQIQDFIEQ